MGTTCLRHLAVASCVFFATAAVLNAEPIDLFSDAPKLAEGFIRIGAWNLRHVNVEGSADEFLPGATLEEDFAILIDTFAKAIDDLGLHLVVIVEHQPRSGKPNRVHQIRDELIATHGDVWKADESEIEYANGGNLQFAVLWDSRRVTIDTEADSLLEDLRQKNTLRAPWLIPVRAGDLALDLLALHLRSGGKTPQLDEVKAVAQFIATHHAQVPSRHLIILGDWNIRPDQSSGRSRLRRFMFHTSGKRMMRVLTPEEIPPTLEEWEALGADSTDISGIDALPFTHFNIPTPDTFLDHMAISTTLDEVFDHPIQVTLKDGTSDLRPGIRIAFPLIPEENYLQLTDHLPVVLLLRTTGTQPPIPTTCDLRIAAALPNPSNDDAQFEEVRLQNIGTDVVTLIGWKVADATDAFWKLNESDGEIATGQTATVVRKNRPMWLNNNGDTIKLIAPDGSVCATKTYGQAASGQVFLFD